MTDNYDLLVDRDVNKKLMNSLFMKYLDTEELQAVIDKNKDADDPDADLLHSTLEQVSKTREQGIMKVNFTTQLNTLNMDMDGGDMEDLTVLQQYKKPSLLKQKTSVTSANTSEVMSLMQQMESAKKAASGDVSIAGIDGQSMLSVRKDCADKYFGPIARAEFFEHYKKMSYTKNKIAAADFEQKRKVSVSDNNSLDLDGDNTLKGVYAEEKPGGVCDEQSFAHDEVSVVSSLFCPDKNSGISPYTNEIMSSMDHLNIENYYEDDDQYSNYDSEHVTDDMTHALSRTDEDFFYELQSVTSSAEINKAIDREILSADSVGHNLFGKSPRSTSRRRRMPKIDKKNHSRRSPKSQSRKEKAVGLPPLAIRPAGSPRFGGTSSKGKQLKLPSTKCTSLVSLASSVSSSSTSISPRTIYLSGCIRDGIRPLPNLILRRGLTTKINLAHYGIGDRMGRVLAECLQELPMIESINLADNNLTDDSLRYLISSIISIKQLKELDLSRNKIDGLSSEALAEYLSREDCPIVRLTMKAADVDDGECDHFVQSLVSNKVLLELDMSENLLGTAESRGEKTGGESIAEYISSDCCRLQVLKLAWNSIRLKSAVTLAKALEFNSTLTELDLSHNGLGWAAGEALGDAIMENRTMKRLILCNNNFTSSATLSVCVGIAENFNMKFVNLNENPIGEAGVKAIMQISVAVGSRMTISAANCNTITADDRCWYDPTHPCRDYKLDLSKPFERAIAFHLLGFIAAHSTYVISRASYQAPGSAVQTLKLIQGISLEKEKYFDEEQLTMLKGLRLFQQAASNSQLGRQLFLEADRDHSGKIDKWELQHVLDSIGFEIEPERLQDIMSVFDIDGGGEIDLQEFLSLLKSQHREATARIRELVEHPIMVLASSPDKKYIPPRFGFLELKVIDGFITKNKFHTISSSDQRYAYHMAKGIGDVTMMTEAFKSAKIRYNEGLGMYRSMYKDIGDKVAVLLKVLPQMLLESEARNLVSKVTNDDRVEIARIKQSCGMAYRPMFGSYNGFYVLDLSNEIHRICLCRLLEKSETMNSKRATESIVSYGKVGDTSQNGNWSCFRNEIYNGKPTRLKKEMFNPMPKSGQLEFDFSAVSRPAGGELRLTDKRLCKVLTNICLLELHNQSDVLRKLTYYKKKAGEMNRARNLYMPIYEFTPAKAKEVGIASDEFYSNLLRRAEFIKKGMKKEEIKINFMRHAAIDVNGNPILDIDPNKISSLAEIGVTVASQDTDDDASYASIEMLATPTNKTQKIENLVSAKVVASKVIKLQTVKNATITIKGAGTDSGTPSVTGGSSLAGDSIAGDSLDNDPELEKRKKKITDLKRRMQALLRCKKGVTIQAKAVRMAEVIDETFSPIWIMCRHLAVIIILFKELFGNAARHSYFGTYAVDLVVYLFPRIIDLHNFEMIFEILEPAECAAVFCRIGMLNIFNPMKPEVTYEVSMDRREERLVAKMIVYLSVVEPGINLTFKTFQWKREQDLIPGWDVTETWMTDEGLPTHGKFTFTYYSGEGKNKLGCLPEIPSRKALMQMVLLDENELIGEDDMTPEDPVNTAEAHYSSHRNVWEDYLLK